MTFWPKTETGSTPDSLRDQQRQDDVVVFDVAGVEAIRYGMLARKTDHALRDATYFSVLAYAGLRPAEAQALRWSRVSEDSIRVLHSNRAGDPNGPLKSARSKRTLRRLPTALADDLATWRKASEGFGADLLFPGAAGGAWTRTEASNWARRAWADCAPDGCTPYSARHTCASLLLRSGVSVAEVAAHMGHGVQMLTTAYAHLIDEYQGRKPLNLDREILKARRAHRDPAAAL